MKRSVLATIEEVPAAFVGLANDRCEGITREWFNRQPLGLPSLTASCYLQGAADMALAIERDEQRRREQITCRSGGAD